eukprot:10442326-Alexandrium_andersonii.AAC.1
MGAQAPHPEAAPVPAVPPAKAPPTAQQLADYRAKCAIEKGKDVLSAQPRRPPVPPKPSAEQIAHARRRMPKPPMAMPVVAMGPLPSPPPEQGDSREK